MRRSASSPSRSAFARGVTSPSALSPGPCSRGRSTRRSGRDLPTHRRASPSRRADTRSARSRSAAYWRDLGCRCRIRRGPAIEAGARLEDFEGSIGTARADAGDWNAAIEDCRGAVPLEPSLPFTHNALGFALLGAGRADQAVDAFRAAVRLDAKFSPAYVGLGRALLATGDFAEARDVVGRGSIMSSPAGNLDAGSVAAKAERMIALDARLPAPSPRPAGPARRRRRGFRIRPALLLEEALRRLVPPLVRVVRRSADARRRAGIRESLSGRACRGTGPTAAGVEATPVRDRGSDALGSEQALDWSEGPKLRGAAAAVPTAGHVPPITGRGSQSN